MKIYHPIGNRRIFLIKKCAHILNYFVLVILSLFLKINFNKNEVIISNSFYAPWKEDKDFDNFYKKIKNLTLLDTKRLYTLWYLSRNLKNINANILDIGCMQGGAGFLMSKSNLKGNTYLLDTFEGFLEEEEFHKKKHFVYKNINEVKENIKLLKLNKTQVFKCKFPMQSPKVLKKKKYKLCHIDVNTYKSTKRSFEFLKDKLVQGGVVVFDDYGIYGTDSIKNYIKKIALKNNKDFTFIYNFMGQCILIKKKS